MVFALVALRAAEQPAIIGTWDCVSSTADGDDQSWTLTVAAQPDGKLQVTLGGGSLGDVTVTDFKAEADKATFTAATGGATYAVKLTVKGTNVEGTFEGEQASGTIKGTRKS
jgi:hypothetical protein